MFVLDSIQINLTAPGERQRIYATINDLNTRLVEIRLVTDAGPWIIPEGTGCSVCFVKPDGHRGVYCTMPDGSLAGRTEGSVLTVLLAPQVLNCPGLVRVSAVLTDGDKQLGIFGFDIHVTHEPGTVLEESADYFSFEDLAQINTAFAGLYAKLDTDSTLQRAGAPADAAAVGTALADKTPVSHLTDVSNPHGVTAQQTGALPLAGGTMTGSVKMGSNSIKGLPEPKSATEPLTQAFMNRSMGLISFTTNTTFDIPLCRRAVTLLGIQLNQNKGFCVYAILHNEGAIKNTTLIAGGYTPAVEIIDGDDTTNYYMRITCDTNYSYGWYITQPPSRNF